MKNLDPYSCFLMLLMTSVLACGPSKSSDELTNQPQTDLQDTSGIQLELLILPEGFEIKLYARVPNARSMALAEDGTVFIGNKNESVVTAIQDSDQNGQADRLYILASDMRMPNGVAYRDGDLYVAEISKLWKFPKILSNLGSPKKELIYDNYPQDGHHGWKYIAFGPDGKLYIPVGAPCNVCESKNEKYASITRMNPDGSNVEIFASGVRNTVGITWHPETDEMYFTDNGRDMMSDDLPPCELNKAPIKGMHFGFPFCHAGTIPDPELGNKRSCEEFQPPIQNLGPHVAPLGLKFKRGDMFPSEYNGSLFIAEHGSWNRSSEAGHTGYKISLVNIENGQSRGYENFITGFLDQKTNKSWGRPVDVLFLKDGSMLISDDKAGAIYRVTYKG
ncbi:MAG: sorbosone dehydrogenase family protein [Cyclobacteriaceae bacterium]